MVHITEISAGFMVISGILSLFLLVLAINAYRRTRSPSMGFLAGAFTLFALKSFLVGYSIWTGLIEHELLELVDAVGDLGAILLIVVPILLPRRGQE